MPGGSSTPGVNKGAGLAEFRETTTMRCIIYTRVSTDAQERDGTSLDTQLVACRDYATGQGWSVQLEIRDSASGYTLDRIGIDQVRRLLREGGTDVVLAFAVDRLSRNQNHIGVLFDEANQAGVKLDFVTEKFEDTAVGRFILAARAFVAEVEREKIVERTQRGKAQRARSGKLPQGTGRGIYGYRYDPSTGTRRVEPNEALIVQEVFEAFAGGASCNGLANSLNARGVPAFGGGQWYPLTVRRILLNETYTGRSVYRRTKREKYRDVRSGKWKVRLVERERDEWIEVEDATPPIVSVSLYHRAKAILEDPYRLTRSKPSRTYALTGRLRCQSCGAPMVGQVLMKGRYSYYRCRSRYVGRLASTCPSKYIRTDVIENAVRNALSEVLANPARVISEAARLSGGQDADGRLTSVLASLQDIEAKQRRLVRLFTDGDLPETLLESERTELSRRRAALEADRAQLEGSATPALDLKVIEQELPRVVEQIRKWVLRAEVDNLSLMLRALDVQMVASPEQVHAKGSVPILAQSIADDLATIARTWA
jgi:site-specific DNA recombinase